MKKIKFLPYRLQALYKVSFIILFFSLVGRPTYAESSDGKINDKSIQNQTTSGHSIELNGIGLAYSYEYAFSPRGTVLLNLGYSFPIAITSGWEAAHIYNVTPYWGFRRVWKHFLFDLAGGVGYFRSSNGYSGIYPTFRIGLGYRF